MSKTKQKSMEELLEEALVPEEEQPYKVPENWVWVKLNSIFEQGKEQVQPTGTENYIGLEHLLKGGGIAEVGNTEGVKSKKVVFKKGDVLYGKLRPYLNKHAYVDFEGVASTDIIVFRSNYLVLNKLLDMFLGLPYVVQYANENSNGINLPRVSPKIMEELPFPLSPLNEQKRIAEKIERLFAKIDEAKRLIEEVRESFELRRSVILNKAFRGELTKKWRKEKLLTNSLEEINLENIQKIRMEKYDKECLLAKVEKRKVRYNKPVYFGEVKKEELNGLPPIPKEWKYVYLGNVSEVVRGASPRPAGDPKYFGGNIPWITVAEITKDKEMYLENVSAYVTEEGAQRSRYIEKGTLLLTNSGATLGVPKITKISGCINDGSVAFVELTNITTEYLYFFLLTQTNKLRALKIGAAQPNLNTNIVNHIIVPLPSLEEQKEIVKIVKLLLKRETEAEDYVNINAIIEEIKQSILSKAFRGELGTNDPTEESAIELLKAVLQSK